MDDCSFNCFIDSVDWIIFEFENIFFEMIEIIVVCKMVCLSWRVLEII